MATMGWALTMEIKTLRQSYKISATWQSRRSKIGSKSGPVKCLKIRYNH